MIAQLTSLQNPRVKRVVRLANRRQRDQGRQTVVEGVREVARALECGVVPVEAYLCPELLDPADATTGAIITSLQRLAAGGKTELFEVTAAVFAKLAYRGESGGVLLVVPYRQTALDTLLLTENPFLLIVVGAEKPGNLGAILRTADAAGVDGVIVAEEQGSGGAEEIRRLGDGEAPQSAIPTPQSSGTDIHNPNVIRASLGAYFTVAVATGSLEEVVGWLDTHGIKMIATTPAADTLYTAVDMTGPVAIVMGSEAFGLSEAWLAAADRLVRIPMLGTIDSLNLSAATALLLYEVIRQRTTSDLPLTPNER